MSEYRSSYTNSHALIVGINTYSDPRFVPLGQAEADANSFAALLSGAPYHFEVTTLLGAQATKSAILRALHQLRRTQPDDRVLVYFAGHGYTLSDKLGNEAGYLACADTVPEEDFTALEMEDVISLTRHAQAKHIAFIFDACFSGQALGLTRAPAVTADKFLQRRAYQVISAGAGDQTVSDYRSMTGSLIEAMRGDELLRDDGLITMSELGLHLRDVIAADSHQTQIPQFGHIRGSQGGDFVFYVDTSVRLPAYLEDALRSSGANTRWGAVADLIEVANGESGDLATIARERLAHIAHEDADERVRKAAQSYFDEITAGGDGTLTQTEIREIRKAREIAPSKVGMPASISKPQAQPVTPQPAPAPPQSGSTPSTASSQGYALNLPLPVLYGVGAVLVVLIGVAVLLSTLNGSNPPNTNDNDDGDHPPATQVAGGDNDNQADGTPDDGRDTPAPTLDTRPPEIAGDPLGITTEAFLREMPPGFEFIDGDSISNEEAVAGMQGQQAEDTLGLLRERQRGENWYVNYRADNNCEPGYAYMGYGWTRYGVTQGAVDTYNEASLNIDGEAISGVGDQAFIFSFEEEDGACGGPVQGYNINFVKNNFTGFFYISARGDDIPSADLEVIVTDMARRLAESIP